MHKVLLAGNGSFRNRGCQAIAIGTSEIVRATFPTGPTVSYAAHSSLRDCIEDLTQVPEARLSPLQFTRPMRKYSKSWAQFQMNRHLRTRFDGPFAHLRESISESSVVLAIGGDNYSLDYGYPERFIQFDRCVMKRGVPLVYWCNSVGPFSADPAFERRMVHHLHSVDSIIVRESMSLEYLRSLGVTANVHLAADPAFAMRAQAPARERYNLQVGDFIGLNFSTTVGRLLSEGAAESHPGEYDRLTSALESPGAYESMCRRYAEITMAIMRRFGPNVLLIPHVTGGSHCDHMFQTRIAQIVRAQGFPTPEVVPPTLNAPELKWVIAQSRLFVGARTHSTIAAFGSGVPTLSLAYSLKARGLTRDMYGDDRFMIPGRQATPDRIVQSLRVLDSELDHLRERLNSEALAMKRRSLMAGHVAARFLR